MTDRSIVVVGIFREGDNVVIVDASEQEYECQNGDELWRDLQTIMDNPDLPHSSVSGAAGPSTGNEMIDAVLGQVEEATTEKYGGFVGGVAAKAARNGGRFGLSLLRTISRKNKRSIG